MREKIKFFICMLMSIILGIFQPVCCFAQVKGERFLTEGIDDAAGFMPVGSDYRIAAGDVINITVFPAGEFSRDYTVQPDGTIEISLVGSIKVVDLKISEFQEDITKKLSKFITNPQVTVNIRKFASRRISILGQINDPGYYDYKEGMKMLDLVALARGLADNARPAKMRIFRRGAAAQEKSFSVNFKAVLDGDLSRDINLYPGDIVYVPRQPIYAGAKWIGDNLVPWITLFMFSITLGVVTTRK